MGNQAQGPRVFAVSVGQTQVYLTPSATVTPVYVTPSATVTPVYLTPSATVTPVYVGNTMLRDSVT